MVIEYCVVVLPEEPRASNPFGEDDSAEAPYYACMNAQSIFWNRGARYFVGGFEKGVINADGLMVFEECQTKYEATMKVREWNRLEKLTEHYPCYTE